jgi:hypothetical protein
MLFSTVANGGVGSLLMPIFILITLNEEECLGLSLQLEYKAKLC